MAAFLGISVWVTLATVVPGLITIAALEGAVLATAPQLGVVPTAGLGDWVTPAFAVTVMVLTQTAGIVLEDVLVRHRWLGPETTAVQIPPGIDPRGEQGFTLEPYAEYKGLYLLLTELHDDEDTQGHLQRCVAQFFLTNNSLVSFGSGILMTLVLLATAPASSPLGGLLYLAGCLLCLVASFRVARIRFLVMSKALWAARRRRLHALATEALDRSAAALDAAASAQAPVPRPPERSRP